MSVSIDAGGNRRQKRALDAELNLVPFIDLLVCCICFLLITAVWTQMANLKTHVNSGGSSGEAGPSTQRLTLLVEANGYTLSLGSERLHIRRQGEAQDHEALARQLRRIRPSLSDGTELTVAAADGIRYLELIRAMDIARQQAFASIRVSDSGAML